MRGFNHARVVQMCKLRYAIALLILSISIAAAFLYSFSAQNPTTEIPALLIFGGALLSIVVVNCDASDNLPGVHGDPLLSSNYSVPQYIYGPASSVAQNTKYTSVYRTSLSSDGSTAIQDSITI